MWSRGKYPLNTLRPRQNGCHFADDTYKCIFANENVRILIQISLKLVPEGPINNIPALVQMMAWRRPGDKPLSEPMMVCLPTHICVTRPQWVNGFINWTVFCFKVNYYSRTLNGILIDSTMKAIKKHGWNSWYFENHGIQELFICIFIK